MILPSGVADMPFADHPAIAVAGAGEHLGQHLLRGRHTKFEERAANCSLHAEANRVSSGHQARARGAADWAGVVAFELNALVGNAIDVGCGDFSAVIADIVPALVVGQDEDDVGLSGVETEGKDNEEE